MISSLNTRRSWWGRFQSRTGSRPSTPSLDEERGQLKQLNEALFALANIFPDVQHEIIREMLGSFPEESRFQVIIETLLKNKEKWLRGRRRTENVQCFHDEVSNTRRSEFRSRPYKDAVKYACYQEFRSLNHSTIKAVLAEKNYFYLDARRCLLDLAAKSWMPSLSSLFAFQRTPAVEQCPLVRWQTSPMGALEPVLVPTACEELNTEIEDLVVSPLKQDRDRVGQDQDQALAEEINEKEAEKHSATFECGVCFSANSFDRTAMCATGEHCICFSCIRHTISEALFGQGWARSIDTHRWTLRCIAIGSGDGCNSYVPRSTLRMTLCSNTESEALWKRFEDYSSKDQVAQVSGDIIRCPCCSYAEVDCSPFEASTAVLNPLYFSLLFLLHLLGLLVEGLLLIISRMFDYHFVHLQPHHRCIRAQATNYKQWITHQPTKPPGPAQQDHNTATPTPSGRKFICHNPSCLRTTCLTCTAPWTDIHICRSSPTQTRAEQFEHFLSARIDEAIKRVCPYCHTAFVKDSGCNKLTCTCGHSLCYICRMDLTKEGYSHFCPHFRAVPGESCGECERCELYRDEVDDVVIRRAREDAVREWREKVGVEEPGLGESRRGRLKWRGLWSGG